MLDLLKLDELDEYERGGRMLIRGDRTPTRGGRILVRGDHRLLRGGRILVRGDHRLLRGGRILVRGDHRLLRGGRMIVRGNRELVRRGRMIVRAMQSESGIDIIEMNPVESRLAGQIATTSADSLAQTLARLPAGFPQSAASPRLTVAGLGNRPPAGVAYIETLEGTSRLSVIVSTSRRRLSVSTPLTAAALNGQVATLRSLLSDPASQPEASAHRLYNLLLPAQITAALDQDHITTLVWSLDGSLRYIPVAALYDGHRYLVERYENVVYCAVELDSRLISTDRTPSRTTQLPASTPLPPHTGGELSSRDIGVCPTLPASGGVARSAGVGLDLVREGVRSALTSRESNSTALGLGVSQAHIVTDAITGTQTAFDALPAVPAELHEVIREPGDGAGVLPGRILIDGGFSARSMRGALASGRCVVHIASHFQLLPGDDAQSYLLLGDGTPMTVAQLEGQTHLFRGVQMLTLSACSTAIGGDGKEIDGLAGVARSQGAESVMATLWPVTDPSTLAFMGRFYTARRTQSSAAALRAAQLSLLHPAGPPGPHSPRGAGTPSPPWKKPRTHAKLDDSSVRVSSPSSGSKGTREWEGGSSGGPYAHPYYWAPFILMGDGR